MKTTNLSKYNHDHHFGTPIKKILWYFTNLLFFKTLFPFSSFFKIKLLKLFGAKVGKNIVIKPNINIKYPWFLTIGNNCWIGEEVWIDNLTPIIIGNNVCLSQGSYLLTGNHDYKKESFDLILGEIIIDNGVWIGAKSIVCPKVHCKEHSILSVGSVANKNLEPYGIYQGNPARLKKKGKLNESINHYICLQQ